MSLLPGAGGEAGAGHALAEAAFGEEVLFEPPELLIEEVVGLVNETDDDVGDSVAGAGFDELTDVLDVPEGDPAGL